MARSAQHEEKPLERITVDPNIFGGKPIIRGRRLAVEHILGMLAGGDRPETIPDLPRAICSTRWCGVDRNLPASGMVDNLSRPADA